jgi:hypothetical protein
MKLATILSSLLAGSLVFGSALSLADRDSAPPPSPRAPKAPRSPAPPPPPGGSISIQLDGLDDLLDRQIGAALDAVGSNDAVPPAVRDKLVKRVDKMRRKLRAKTAGGKLDPQLLAELGQELERELEGLGSEMEAWGEQFGKDMEKWGEQFGKDMEKWGEQFGKQFGSKHGPRPGPPAPPDLGGDDLDDLDDFDADYSDALRDLGDLKLAPAQREQLRRLRVDSDAKVAAARRELDRLSAQLQRQLDAPGTSDAEISRSIDAVTQQEAAIRKARILAWVSARRVLDDTQRKQVEAAARGRTK